MFVASSLILVSFLVSQATATPTKTTNNPLTARAASCSFPTAPETSSLPSPITVAAGKTFDVNTLLLSK